MRSRRYIRRLASVGISKLYDLYIDLYVLLRGATDMVVFRFLRDHYVPGTSASALAKNIEKMFPNPMDIPGWEFRRDVEEPFVRELAKVSPDALLPVVPALVNHFRNVKRYPRQMTRDLDQIKRCVADTLATSFESRPISSGDTIRAVIMVPWLPQNPNNNMLRVVLGYLSGLLRNPDVDDAILIVTNENAVEASSDVSGLNVDARLNEATFHGVAKEFGVPADKIKIAPPPLEAPGNAVFHETLLKDFAPNVVFVPNIEMTSAYIHGCAKSAATVYLQTSVRNRPPQEFNRYLYLGERRVIDNTHVNPDRWHYHSFGYENFGAGTGLKRADIGLADDDIVLVTAGNRLEAEVTEEIAGLVAAAAAVEPKLKWMLLGARNQDGIVANMGSSHAALADRLIFKGYVREIGDHLALSDVYVNPRRTGGAVSMALAVYGGTPVLSFTGNDAGNFLVDDMIAATPEAYRQTLLRLVREPAYLKDVERRQREKFDAGHTVDASAADLVQHFKATLRERAS